MQAMRFPPKSYNKELESAEDRREREAQVAGPISFHDVFHWPHSYKQLCSGIKLTCSGFSFNYGHAGSIFSRYHTYKTLSVAEFELVVTRPAVKLATLQDLELAKEMAEEDDDAY